MLLDRDWKGEERRGDGYNFEGWMFSVLMFAGTVVGSVHLRSAFLSLIKEKKDVSIALRRLHVLRLYFFDISF